MAINKGPSIISPLSLNVLPTAYGDCPPEGKRFIPYYIDWSTGQSFTLDFTMLQELRRFSFIQSMIIDNFLEVGDSITITINNFLLILYRLSNQQRFFLSYQNSKPLLPLHHKQVRQPEIQEFYFVILALSRSV